MWEDEEDSEDDLDDVPPSFPQSESTSDGATGLTESIVLWLTGFLLLLQARHFIPDAAMDALLKFIGVLFRVLGRLSSVVASIALAIPNSVYRLRKTAKNSRNFTRYVVCPKCHQLYAFGDCVIVSGGQHSSKTCTYIRFPNHPHRRQRTHECGQILMKTVQFTSTRRILYPFKVFPYKSVVSSLQDLLVRPEFADSCQHWKSRNVNSTFDDVYDGKIWKEFQVVGGKDFLASTETLSLGLMINVDWFQPYKHTTYSVGAIYLTVMNLPRSLRYKRQNVILVGILPGPSEPKHDINAYIEPLVNELLDLWHGVTFEVHSVSGVLTKVVRCALLCVSCDLPAGRKLCGFLGHSAKLGCSKCLKSFPGSLGAMNYSGFDRAQWPPRVNHTHRDNVSKILRLTSKSKQADLESKLGCRYSCLLKLPYFDAPRMLVIDPMHNLFLGTAKHMLHLWLQKELISVAQYHCIQDNVNRMVVPSDIGRIPHKIASSFSGFTADQFKNWTTIYSIPALYGILPSEHLQCWRHFVLACRILCKQSLSVADIRLADALLLQFCTCVQDLFGEMCITPNMHMHGHLKEVLEDFGPVYAIWCFSFERYNGILGSQPNNNRSIEPQLMGRFMRDNFAYSFNFPAQFHEDFSPVCCDRELIVGSLADTIHGDADDTLKPASSCVRCTFDDIDRTYVATLHQKLKPEMRGATVNSIYLRYTSMSCRGKRYDCRQATSRGLSSVALCEWDSTLFDSPPTPLPDAAHPQSKFRPVKIRYFIKASIAIEENGYDHLLLAVVLWYLPHPNKDIVGKPTQIWHHNKFEAGNLYSFVPVEYLKCRCAASIATVSDESVLLVVPLVE